MSGVEWVCQKISLESASEQLAAITIYRRFHVSVSEKGEGGLRYGNECLHSKPDACANVTTCCFHCKGVVLFQN